MGTDSKLLPIPLSAGIDQSMDEFAAPPGTIRHSINTRVRQGGSLEQRRGVHGFAVSTPSYMANFQATGRPEFVGAIGNAAAFGMAGRAYAHDRSSQFAYYAGEYSQYEPLARETAILTEKQHGLFGCRHAAYGFDLLGRKYLATASLCDENVECRIANEAGHTVASFLVETAAVVNVEMYAGEAPYIYLFIQRATTATDRLLLYKIQLGGSVSYTVHDFNINNSDIVAHPIPTGSFHNVSGVNPDSMLAAETIASGVGACLMLPMNGESTLGHQRYLRTGHPSGASLNARFNFAVGRTPQSYTVLGATPRGGSGNIAFAAASQATAPWDGVPRLSAGPTGVLLASGVGYSAPIIAATSDPQRFLWLASNGITTFGDLVLPSGPARVRIIGTMAGIPLSLMDSRGAHWSMTELAEFPALPTAARAVLVAHPAAVPSLADYAKPLVQLSAERQLTTPNPLIWDRGQFQYARIAEDGGGRQEVLLPLQLRSQGSGLVSLERYTYKHTPSSDGSRQSVSLKSKLLVAGQPGEFYPSPNRVGIGVVTGAPTFAARPQLASEVGFAGEPRIATLASASGANIAPGSRLYTAIFEWLSPAGERHRSRPAAPQRFVNATNAGVAPVVPEEFRTQRFPSPRVHYYRTVDGQKQFLRISPDTGVEPGTQFYDHNSDDDIRDNEVLYTDGGVQPNDLAPSCRFMALGEDRLWLGGLFESDIIQCSKFFVPREPVQFSDLDSFKVRLPFPCTGLAYLDGSLVAFCEGSTYLISGAGPNNQGVGGFTLRPIADNVGCDDHRSIIATSIGVFFKSKRGIQLLPRGFGSPEQIRNLNELMGEFGDGFTEVIGATTRDYSDEETVRFLLRNPSTNRRIVATYELGTSTWNYDVIKDENGNEVPLSAIGDGPEGVVYGARSGTYRFMTELEGLAGTPYDSMGSTVNRFLSEVHLSKMSVFGPAGEGKAKAVTLRGFAPATGAQVSLSLVTDYGTQTHTFSGIGSGTFFRRIVPALQDSSEMQISATFSTGVGRKTGLKLLSLTLELDPKAGARRARQGEQE